MTHNEFIRSAEDYSDADNLQVWTSDRMEQLSVAMDEGYKPKDTPFYEGDPLWRKGNIVFEWTDEELAEIKKCASDIVYFANNYCSVMTDDGVRTIKLRDYQEEMLEGFVDNRFAICLSSRQTGKTICSSIFIAWYTLFNFDKNALILSNKGGTTKEIIDKARTIFENLPFFMKPGVIKKDVMHIKFDNGCRIVGQSTSGKAGIGFTIHLLFLDEFAHIHHSFIESFYENVYPTLSSSKISRIIITSTPNGYNKFYKIYRDAERGKNEFMPFRVDWWQVPGRDEEWKQREIANLGSEEAFNRQFGNQFQASSNLLLSGSSIKRLKRNQKEFIYHDFEEFEDIQIDVDRHLFWHPDFDTQDCKNEEKFWAFSIDIGEGNGGDMSIINMFEVIPMQIKEIDKLPSPGALQDFFALKQIGIFRSNEHSVEDLAKVLYTLMINIFYPENIKVILEWNAFGGELLLHLQTIFPRSNEFDEELIVKFKHRVDARVSKFGLKLKADNRTLICQDFKKYVEQRRIILLDEYTINEASLFGLGPTGKYEAQMGNDDAIMSSINISTFFNTIDYADFVEEKLDLIPEELQIQMEKILYKGEDKSDGNLHYDIYGILNQGDNNSNNKDNDAMDLIV